ncbi:HNH endonuclease [Actinomadura sp. NAK00032]|uniref:HNH endonuclease signature motif containing protein n=1 Tax=Actinomadura sp. NAK00032 TaxID=2742128 RepID=UPI0015927594|nr:HNH endonuclease signature motif containing protein [Actinomadura sp. NAK00032]QKW39951.1 HNH endonuclease [Actinomadura sp. NAK00032]
MDLSVITREAVLSALAECDEIGRHRFLELYGFEPARQYFIHHDGVYYDSKAIVGVAYRYVAGRPLTADQFSGGRQTVGRLLTRLGFEVVNDEPASPQRLLIEVLESLRIASTRDGPARHQPITLLWAFGRAAQRRPRLVHWRAAHAELRGLMREYGQPSSRPTPEFPIVALAHTDLWELAGHGGAVPAAHGKPIAWLEEQEPHCGLMAWAYELIVCSDEVRSEAVATLGTRFFGGVTPEELLVEVGLQTPGPAATAASAESSPLELYRRLCWRIEAAETRGAHERTSTTMREQPVRSAAAVEAVLIRSAGRCENPLCTGEPNDVTTNGDPILEVDHVQDRAQWGRDHPIQMIALCPNCHAIKTRGRTGEQLRHLLLKEARARHLTWVGQA